MTVIINYLLLIMELPKLNKNNADNTYLQALHNFASTLPSIGGNNCLSFVVMDKDDFIKLTGSEVEYIIIKGVQEPINRSTGVLEITNARNTVNSYVDYPTYEPLQSVNGNMPSQPQVSNHLQEHQIRMDAARRQDKTRQQVINSITKLRNAILESLDEYINQRLITKYTYIRSVQLWQVVSMIHDEYIKMDSAQHDLIKQNLCKKLDDATNLNNHIFKYNEGIERLRTNNIILPSNQIAEDFLNTIEDLPAIKTVIEEYRRINPNKLLHNIKDIFMYLDQQKDNINRKNLTITQMINDNSLNFTKRIEQLEKELIQANNAKVKNNTSAKQKKEKDKKQAKYCYHCGYGSHLGTECYYMNADTHAENLTNAISPKVKGEIDGNSKVHFRFQK